MKGENNMADEKIYYTIVKLAPNVSSWCDIENNIYLSRPNKMFKRLKEGCDMKMINKGVKAGLIILEVRCEEDEPNTPGVPVPPEHPTLPEDPLDPPVGDNDNILPEVENAAPLYCLRSKNEVQVELNIIEESEEE
jgi:hypothetical protein